MPMNNTLAPRINHTTIRRAGKNMRLVLGQFLLSTIAGAVLCRMCMAHAVNVVC
jgi:hypothetical protein